MSTRSAPVPAATAVLRLGSVPYLNAQPLVAGLDERDDVRLETDVPARLARRLRAGELDAALVSAVELFRDPPLAWVPATAVSSDGPVRSIRVYLRTAPERAASLALDASSLSAAALARVCFAEFFGRAELRLQTVDPSQALDAIDADAVLRIGDPALLTDPGPREVLDLGELWTERTGLPFVYALWLARPDVPAHPLVDVLTAARDLGMLERAALARRFARIHALDPAPCVAYMSSDLSYAFGPRERAGLERFGRLAAAHGLVDRSELPAPVGGG